MPEVHQESERVRASSDRVPSSSKRRRMEFGLVLATGALPSEARPMKRVTALLAALLLSSAAQAQLAQDLGPGGTSSLATRSAATAPGTWSAEWKDGFLSGAHTSPNGEDPVTSNGIRGVWYSGDKTIHYYGHGHSGFRS